LPKFLRTQQEELATLFPTLAWNGTVSALEDQVEKRIERDLGLGREALPATARPIYEQGMIKLQQALAIRRDAREQLFRDAVDAHARKVEFAWRDRLRVDDPAGAQRAMLDAIEGFAGIAGSPPEGDLPTDLRTYVQGARTDLGRRARTEIDTVE